MSKDCQVSAVDPATQAVLTCLVDDRGVADEVIPADSQYLTLTAHVERFQFRFIGFEQRPHFTAVQKDRQDQSIVESYSLVFRPSLA